MGKCFNCGGRHRWRNCWHKLKPRLQEYKNKEGNNQQQRHVNENNDKNMNKGFDYKRVMNQIRKQNNEQDKYIRRVTLEQFSQASEYTSSINGDDSFQDINRVEIMQNEYDVQEIRTNYSNEQETSDNSDVEIININTVTTSINNLNAVTVVEAYKTNEVEMKEKSLLCMTRKPIPKTQPIYLLANGKWNLFPGIPDQGADLTC